ncbi:hypothetical protein [Kribbella ginsengisoli]|uniref:Uncharacterized protein n=1 Tax=Kribbella ginsengisoli TaxID=363865 RepID=A0ABP6XBC8_9ACTN
MTDSGQLWLWIALSAMAAMLIATIAGVLAWLGGASVPDAIARGGVAFVGALTLFLLIIALTKR